MFTVGPPLNTRTRTALGVGALVAPPFLAFASILAARFLSMNVFAVVGIGVAVGIVSGSWCLARLVRTRLLSFASVLIYLAVVVPCGLYLWAWSRCAALGDCL